ncbi:hypothetical protein M5G27_19745 [Pseudomonas shahriarae]|uniref:Uncharacterized protein n=1 Tax=Pseudomonas shahriarae TaxID=2745512 RepID=A0A9X4C3S5_9PSED|nr:hypothetical protein [Pseudomonas shahriarae]MDD1009715.1 hypothetical protein [Pseudomonas shahriarae]
MAFVDRHRHILQRAIMDGKCDGFIISTTAAAKEETQIFLATQSSLWHLKEATLEARERFLTFAHAQSRSPD